MLVLHVSMVEVASVTVSQLSSQLTRILRLQVKLLLTLEYSLSSHLQP